MSGVTRIVSGSASGRRLTVPKGDATRPTSEMVREALFNALESRNAVRGAKVIDLFAGSGALGLEAASRGAAEVVLVDSSRQATGCARRNASELGFLRVAVVLSSAERYVSGHPPFSADLVLLDPPYPMSEDALATVLAGLASPAWVAPSGLVVVERAGRSPEPRWPDGFRRSSVRRYGDTAVWTAQHAPVRAGDGG
jgi:16S rRNA (guanine966-N2)-methyltransferase